MDRPEISRILNDSIEDLFRDDLILLRNDVSERAITHKLAKHLQSRVPKLHVDCEYNRNVERGPRSPKYLYLIEQSKKELLGDKLAKEIPEEVLKAHTKYPDIIVHRRGTNDQNVLVIEAKKDNSGYDDDLDVSKVRGFTSNEDENSYHYKHGVLIKFQTGVNTPARPKLRWFTDGCEDAE